MKRQKKICFIILANLFLFYLLSEIILLFLGLPKEFKPHSFPPQFQRVNNEAILYVNKPNTSIDFQYDGNPRGYFRNNNLVSHQTNNFGFRGREFALQKEPETYRTAILGDSFTFGEGVYFEDTYSEKLAQILQNESFFKNRQIEVLNLGVGGYNTTQEAALLDEFVSQLKPDLVILGLTLNDAEPYLFTPQGPDGLLRRPREKEAPEEIALFQRPPTWMRISRFARLLWQKRENALISQQTVRYYRSLFKEDSPGWQAMQKALEEISLWSKSHQTPVFVLIFPLLYNLKEDYPFTKIHTQVAQTLQKFSLPCVNLLPDLTKYEDATLWVHPTDQHPNEIVHQIAAQKLAEKILASF